MEGKAEGSGQKAEGREKWVVGSGQWAVGSGKCKAEDGGVAALEMIFMVKHQVFRQARLLGGGAHGDRYKCPPESRIRAWRSRKNVGR